MRMEHTYISVYVNIRMLCLDGWLDWAHVGITKHRIISCDCVHNNIVALEMRTANVWIVARCKIYWRYAWLRFSGISNYASMRFFALNAYFRYVSVRWHSRIIIGHVEGIKNENNNNRPTKSNVEVEHSLYHITAKKLYKQMHRFVSIPFLHKERYNIRLL